MPAAVNFMLSDRASMAIRPAAHIGGASSTAGVEHHTIGEPVEMNAIGQVFLDQSRHYLTHQYLPRIAASVERLSAEDLWWRGNPASNSAGNLLLHLAGNARQWIISGLGGAPDHRQRQREFDARDGGSAAELLERLRNTVREADAVLAAIDPDALLERRVIQ